MTKRTPEYVLRDWIIARRQNGCRSHDAHVLANEARKDGLSVSGDRLRTILANVVQSEVDALRLVRTIQNNPTND